MPPAMPTPEQPDHQRGHAAGRRSGQEPTAGSDDQAVPLTLFTLQIETGSEVKVRSPRAGEGGTWWVTGQATTTNADDPAYDVTNTSTGRRRVFRGSRLTVVRAARRQSRGGRSR